MRLGFLSHTFEIRRDDRFVRVAYAMTHWDVATGAMKNIGKMFAIPTIFH